jgi:hypothetical protein
MNNNDQICDSCGYPIIGEGHLSEEEDADGHVYVEVLCETCWRLENEKNL